MLRVGILRRPLAAVAALSLVALTGCPDDPYDPNTWIEKLDNPSEVERAVTELERFEDPKAIEPLAKTWEKYQRSTRVLRIIIKLAAQDEEGEGKFYEDGPYWDKARPVLEKALEELDIGDNRSIDNAALAADALGEAGDSSAVPLLIKAVNTNMPKLSRAQDVRLRSIRSLGKFGDNERAVDTLIKVLEAEPKEQRIELFAAAALALGETRSDKAIVPLLEAMFKVGPIFPQVRRAIVGIGPKAVPHLVKIFNNEHKEINDLARKNKFNVDCWPNGKGADKQAIIGLGTTCQHPTQLEFKSALLLGDLSAKSAAPVLIKGLDDVPLPSYVQKESVGPPQHDAILGALSKIQPPADMGAHDRVRRFYLADDTDDSLRPKAIDVYSFLAPDADHIGDLASRMRPDRQDCSEKDKRKCPFAREEFGAAMIAYGRLASSAKHLEPLDGIIAGFKRSADGLDKQLDGLEKKRKAAEEALKKAETAWEESPAGKKAAEAAKEAAKAGKVATDDKKKDEPNTPEYKALDKAKAAFKKIDDEFVDLEQLATQERALQRGYEQAKVRGLVAIHCKGKADCLATIWTDDKALDELLGGKDGKSGPVDGYGELSKDDKKAFMLAAADRGLLDLIKMGSKAKGVTDTLLEHVGSTERIIRQGVLLALMHTADLPAERKKILAALDAVIKRQGDESTLRALTVETETSRNFFLWAGDK
jgi:tetratricopeptide (TPR) repeat protein